MALVGGQWACVRRLFMPNTRYILRGSPCISYIKTHEHCVIHRNDTPSSHRLLHLSSRLHDAEETTVVKENTKKAPSNEPVTAAMVHALKMSVSSPMPKPFSFRRKFLDYMLQTFERKDKRNVLSKDEYLVLVQYLLNVCNQRPISVEDKEKYAQRVLNLIFHADEPNIEHLVDVLKFHKKYSIPFSMGRVVNFLQEKNIPLNSPLFQCFIFNCSINGEMDIAKNLHEKMLAANIRDGSTVWSDLITGHLVSGDVDTAQELFTEAVGKFKNEHPYIAMIAGYALREQLDKAEEVFLTAKDNGVEFQLESFVPLLQRMVHQSKTKGFDMVVDMCSKGVGYMDLKEKLDIMGTCLLKGYDKEALKVAELRCRKGIPNIFHIAQFFAYGSYRSRSNKLTHQHLCNIMKTMFTDTEFPMDTEVFAQEVRFFTQRYKDQDISRKLLQVNGIAVYEFVRLVLCFRPIHWESLKSLLSCVKEKYPKDPYFDRMFTDELQYLGIDDVPEDMKKFLKRNETEAVSIVDMNNFKNVTEVIAELQKKDTSWIDVKSVMLHYLHEDNFKDLLAVFHSISGRGRLFRKQLLAVMFKEVAKTYDPETALLLLHVYAKQNSTSFVEALHSEWFLFMNSYVERGEDFLVESALKSLISQFPGSKITGCVVLSYYLDKKNLQKTQDLYDWLEEQFTESQALSMMLVGFALSGRMTEAKKLIEQYGVQTFTKEATMLQNIARGIFADRTRSNEKANYYNEQLAELFLLLGATGKDILVNSSLKFHSVYSTTKCMNKVLMKNLRIRKEFVTLYEEKVKKFDPNNEMASFVIRDLKKQQAQFESSAKSKGESEKVSDKAATSKHDPEQASDRIQNEEMLESQGEGKVPTEDTMSDVSVVENPEREEVSIGEEVLEGGSAGETSGR